MFYNLLAKTNNTTLVLLVPMLCSFLIAFFSLKFFKRILPKDQGRAFAVNGALSEGKPRGAGIIFAVSASTANLSLMAAMVPDLTFPIKNVRTAG